MRRTCFILVLTSILASCEEGSKTTTCQVINTLEEFESEIADYNGTMYSANLHCFIGIDQAEVVILGDIAPGDSSEVLLVDKEFTKLKFSFKLLPGTLIYQDMYYNPRLFGMAYYYLEKNEHHEIVFNDHTFVSRKLIFGKAEEGILIEDMIIDQP